MISTECTFFTFPVIHLVHFPPRPLSRKNRITLLGITVVPGEIQGKAKLMQNCGGGGGGGGEQGALWAT